MKTVRSPLYRRLLTELRTARRAAGLSQVEVARALRRPQSFVAKVESGERRLDVVEYLELTEALDIDGIALLESATRARQRD